MAAILNFEFQVFKNIQKKRKQVRKKFKIQID